jgi:hypothetical protein
MGRKPLPKESLQPLLDFAMQEAKEGITRHSAIKAGVITNSRWALLKNRLVSNGSLIRVGWKKSARYYAPEFAPKVYDDETGLELPHEEELETTDLYLEQTNMKTQEMGGMLNDMEQAIILARKGSNDDIESGSQLPENNFTWADCESVGDDVRNDSPPEVIENRSVFQEPGDPRDKEVDNFAKVAGEVIDTPIESEEEDWDFDFV